LTLAAGTFVKGASALAKERGLPISLAKNKVKGLAIKCVRDIKDGEVVLEDMTILTVSSQDEEQCEQCLATLEGTKVPCTNCGKVVYCGRDCRSEHVATHNEEECRLLQKVDIKGTCGRCAC